MDGMLLVNKPSGVTSHDVVDVVRRQLGVQRVGHTGTLDPTAQGLLILLVGRATKSQRLLQAQEKRYEAVLRLGLQTDTGDAAGAPIRSAPVPELDRCRIESALASLQGPLLQTPPAYSAVKVSGRPAYWWARRQQPVPLSPRVVHLYEIALIGCVADTITFSVRCSAGTYVRVLAESVAERLGTVGHLAGLVRQGIGPWDVARARPLAWISQASPDAIARELVSVPVSIGRTRDHR